VGGAATEHTVNPKYFSSVALDTMLGIENWDLNRRTGQILYVIGLSLRKKFDDFRDPTTFRNKLDQMHKLLFNRSLETLLVGNSGGEEIVGKRVVTNIGIVVIPLIAHIPAGFLELVVVCLGGVFLVFFNRQNNLVGDLNTQEAMMALIAYRETLGRDFNSTDECPAPDLCMKSRKYKLGTWGGRGGYRPDAVEDTDNPLAQNLHASCTVPHGYKLVGPIELTLWTGLTATLMNIALLTLLIILDKSALRWNGAT